MALKGLVANRHAFVGEDRRKNQVPTWTQECTDFRNYPSGKVIKA